LAVYNTLIVTILLSLISECLKSSGATALKGDYLFHFKCEACGGGEEEFSRMRLQWYNKYIIAL